MTIFSIRGLVGKVALSTCSTCQSVLALSLIERKSLTYNITSIPLHPILLIPFTACVVLPCTPSTTETLLS